MGLLARIFATLPFRKPSPDSGSSFIYSRPAAGIPVTEDIALRYSAFWTCVRVRSETMASLPWHLMEYADAGKRKLQVTDDPLAALLRFAPNPEMTIADWVGAMTACTDTWGNAYAPIERTRGGAVIHVWWPLHPARVCMERDERTDELYYSVRDDHGIETRFASADMFHIKGMSLDGLTGLSIVGYMRETIAHGMAADKFGANLFGQGLRPSAIIEVPGKQTPEQEARLREGAQAMNAGINNSGKIFIVSGGAKVTPFTIHPDDAQFIETKLQTRREVYAAMRVPPHKCGDLEHAHYNNVEHAEIAFSRDVVLPTALKFELEAQRKLIPARQLLTRFTKMNLSGLLRGDMKSRYEAHNIARMGGWRSANGVLRIEDEDLINDPHGDEYWRPANMLVAGAPEILRPGPATDGERTDDSSLATHAVVSLRMDAVRKKELNACARHVDDVPDKRLAWSAKFYGAHLTAMEEAFAACVPVMALVIGLEPSAGCTDLVLEKARERFRDYCTAQNESSESGDAAWSTMLESVTTDAWRILKSGGG